MAIHQKANGHFDNVDLTLPHKSKGHLYMELSGGTTVNFHMPKGSNLAMLFSNGKRVNINERS